MICVLSDRRPATYDLRAREGRSHQDDSMDPAHQEGFVQEAACLLFIASTCTYTAERSCERARNVQERTLAGDHTARKQSSKGRGFCFRGRRSARDPSGGHRLYEYTNMSTIPHWSFPPSTPHFTVESPFIPRVRPRGVHPSPVPRRAAPPLDRAGSQTAAPTSPQSQPAASECGAAPC